MLCCVQCLFFFFACDTLYRSAAFSVVVLIGEERAKGSKIIK